MSLQVISGNIFSSPAQTLVNTVNCAGVMGAGIALEFRLRYPEMVERYTALCDEGRIRPGVLWTYRGRAPWVLNFPTKVHWRDASRKEYLRAGLENFVSSYEKRGIQSVSFPLLGADKGGIAPEESLSIMKSHLRQVSIPVSIYRYDPRAEDDLFSKFRARILALAEDEPLGSVSPRYVKLLKKGVQDPEMFQINQLLKIKGLGVRTLERVYRAMLDEKSPRKPTNDDLFG